ncbi:hypothetical protein [Minwuia sp.]|uniref:hypothetical protein n=1 Tax=Minwuia sp. TaxID=2493630 RepID=UPI003A8E85D1
MFAAPDSGLLPYLALRTVHDYWQGLPRQSGVAQILKVDPMLLAPALGSIILLDVVDGGRDFYYSLYGSKIANFSGFDMTHKYLSEIPTDSPVTAFFRVCYLAVMKHRIPLYTVHRAPRNIMIGSWHRLILPLGAGDEVCRLLVCNIPTRPDGNEK